MASQGSGPRSLGLKYKKKIRAIQDAEWEKLDTAGRAQACQQRERMGVKENKGFLGLYGSGEETRRTSGASDRAEASGYRSA